MKEIKPLKKEAQTRDMAPTGACDGADDGVIATFCNMMIRVQKFLLERFKQKETHKRKES